MEQDSDDDAFSFDFSRFFSSKHSKTSFLFLFFAVIACLFLSVSNNGQKMFIYLDANVT